MARSEISGLLYLYCSPPNLMAGETAGLVLVSGGVVAMTSVVVVVVCEVFSLRRLGGERGINVVSVIVAMMRGKY